MKLIKMLPMVGLLFSLSVSSAFAVGKDTADETTGKMCAKLEAALIKKDGKGAAAATPAAPREEKGEPANGTTAM